MNEVERLAEYRAEMVRLALADAAFRRARGRREWRPRQLSAADWWRVALRYRLRREP